MTLRNAWKFVARCFSPRSAGLALPDSRSGAKATRYATNPLKILRYGLLVCLGLCSTTHAAKEILLRTAPEAAAPVIAKVTASEKVILDAAPAPRNAEQGWRQLALPTPFEGYVPIAAMDKNFVIVHGTPVHYLPTANAARITTVAEGDAYEVVRATDDWATVRFRKDITGYFIDDATEAVAIDFESLQVPLVKTEPAPASEVAPEPLAIPAPRARVNPDEPIGQLDPNSLPPENVVWEAAARSRGSESEGERESLSSAAIPADTRSGGFSRHPGTPSTAAEAAATPASRISDPASRIPHSDLSRRSPDREEAESRISNPDLMVTEAQTQAREAAPEFGPAKAPRLLTGVLKQDLSNDGAAYPIRLISPEGRLVAYVDFSGVYISDLTPYLNQKVYIRGQIHPLPNSSARLVILAESLRLAE